MSNAQNYPQVLEFLRQCDLLEYYDRLISEGFDQMRSLFDITEMDLIAMNVKRGHRRRIQREIATMKGIPTSQPLHIQSEPGLGPINDYSSSTTSASTNLSTSMTNPGKNIIPTIAAAPGSSIPVLIDGPNGGRSRGFDYNNNYGYSYNNNNVGESCARHQPPNLPPLNHSQQSFYNNNNESSFQRQIALTLSKPSTMTINQPSRNIAATAAYTTTKFNSNNDQYSSSYPLPNKTNLNLTLNNPNDPNNNEDANNNNGKRKYKRHPKRDKNAPVKPLSAYVMFSHKVREEYQGKNISFPDMAKIVGDRWKSIPAEEKEMIENEAAKAKEEYLAAMTVYKTTDKWKQYQEYLKDFKEKHDPNCKLSSDRESNKGRKRSKFNVNSPDSDQTTNSGYSSTRSTSLGYVSSGSSNNGNSNGTHNGNNGNDGSSNQNNSNIRNIHNIHSNNDINNSNKNYTSVATTNFSSSLPSSSKNNNKNNNDNNNDNNNNNNNYIPPYAHSNPTMPFYNHRNNKTTGSSTTTTSTFANISSNSNASTSISTNNSSTSLSPNINNTSLSGLLIHPKDCDKKKSDDNNNSNCDGDNSGRHSNSNINSDSNSDSDNGNDNDNQIFEDFTISNNFGSSSTNTTSSPNNESFDGGNNNQNQNSLTDQEEEQQEQQQQQPSSSSSSISPSSSFSSSFSSSSQ